MDADVAATARALRVADETCDRPAVDAPDVTAEALLVTGLLNAQQLRAFVP